MEEAYSIFQESLSGDQQLRCSPGLEKHGGLYTCRVIRAEGKNIYVGLYASYLGGANGVLLNESEVKRAVYIEKPFSKLETMVFSGMLANVIAGKNASEDSFGAVEMNCTFSDYVLEGENLNLTISCDKEVPAKSTTYMVLSVVPVVFPGMKPSETYASRDSEYCEERGKDSVCYLNVDFFAERRP